MDSDGCIGTRTGLSTDDRVCLDGHVGQRHRSVPDYDHSVADWAVRGQPFVHQPLAFLTQSEALTLQNASKTRACCDKYADGVQQSDRDATWQLQTFRGRRRAQKHLHVRVLASGGVWSGT